MGLSLGSLGVGIGQILSRTVFIQPNGPAGIPIPLAVLDVVKNEVVDYDAEVSEHGVEEGPEVSDHVQLHNVTLRLKGTISSTPLDLSVAIANLAAGAYAAVTDNQARSNLLNSGFSQSIGMVGAALQGNAGNVGASAFSGAVDAVSRTILIAVWQARMPFTIVTKRQTYPNMIIKRLSFPRDQETGYALDFEMDIKQMRIVSTLKVQKNSVGEDVISTASSSTGLGSQSTSEANSQIQSQVQQSSLGQAPGMSTKFPGVFA